jgi:hypothetical protein
MAETLSPGTRPTPFTGSFTGWLVFTKDRSMGTILNDD